MCFVCNCSWIVNFDEKLSVFAPSELNGKGGGS
jgi:hypothetical protein